MGNHSEKTSNRQYGLSIDTVVQAHQTMCTEWQTWVLNRGRDRARPHAAHGDGQQDRGQHDDAAEYWQNDDEAPSSQIEYAVAQERLWCLPRRFVELRPIQREAMDAIWHAHGISKRERRIATVSIVTPTGSGKDLLPLALSQCTKGTAVVFQPFVCVKKPEPLT